MKDTTGNHMGQEEQLGVGWH